jgi:integrase
MSVAARPRHPVTGRRFWLRASTPRELDAYLHRVDSLRTELRLGLRTPEAIDRELRHLRHGPVTLERAAVAYLERPIALNTKRRIRSLLSTHWSELAPRPLASIDGPAAAAWVESLTRADLEPTTVATAWRSLRAVARYATEKGWIGSIPWGSYRPVLGRTMRRGREAARTVSELVRLLAAAAALERDDEVRFFGLQVKIALAALLGLRQGELAGLRWIDVAWGPPLVLTITRQWERGPLKSRAAPKALQTIAELAELLTAHEQKLRARELYLASGPIFPSPSRSAPGFPRAYLRGEVLTRLQLRSAVEVADLPNVGAWSAHSMRDTFVTLETDASGGDLGRVQARSRHASLSSLARYLRALSRSTPAAPALSCLPRPETDAAGLPLLAIPSTQKETPPTKP